MPNKIKNSTLKSNAQKLRNNMTDEEKHLWFDFLSKLPVTVNRQKVIGNYIVDFYCANSKLIIELDGKQHRLENAFINDIERDDILRSMGYTVMRFENREIREDFRAVCDKIKWFIFGNEC